MQPVSFQGCGMLNAIGHRKNGTKNIYFVPNKATPVSHPDWQARPQNQHLDFRRQNCSFHSPSTTAYYATTRHRLHDPFYVLQCSCLGSLNTSHDQPLAWQDKNRSPLTGHKTRFRNITDGDALRKHSFAVKSTSLHSGPHWQAAFEHEITEIAHCSQSFPTLHHLFASFQLRRACSKLQWLSANSSCRETASLAVCSMDPNSRSTGASLIGFTDSAFPRQLQK
jgi:hypothetical protein